MRTFLACLIVVLLVAVPPAAAANGGGAEVEWDSECPWSYEGATGPDHWWQICSPKYALCKAGTRQSPIDVGVAQPADLPRLGFDYRRTPFKMVAAYGGQELQAQAPEDTAQRIYLLIGSETYRLVQFHFHTPCEHCRNEEFPMELHLVHHNDLGEIAAVGVFVNKGNPNPAFQTFLDTPLDGTSQLQPLDLLPARRGYVRYAGSLTTPACSEGVRWHVLKEGIEVSQGQIDQFRARYPRTARTPLQNLGGRPVLQSRD